MSEDDHEAPERSGTSRHVRRPRPHGRRARRIDPAADGAVGAEQDATPRAQQQRALEEARRALRSRRDEEPSSPAQETESGATDAPVVRPRGRRASMPLDAPEHEPAPEDERAPSSRPADRAAAPEGDAWDRASGDEHEAPEAPGTTLRAAAEDDIASAHDATGEGGAHDGYALSDEYNDAADAEDDEEGDDSHPFADFEHEHRRRSPLHVLPVLLVLVVVLAVGAGAVYGYSWLRGNVNVTQAQDDDFEGTGSNEEVVIEVAEGDTGSDIAATLVDKGVIKSASPFVRLFSSSQDASRIQPGSYRLNTRMSSAAALDALLDPSSQTGLRVTIPEGMRMKDIFERISKTTGIPVEDFEKAAKNYTDYGIPKNRADSPEGYLWPGRYDIPEDASAGDVLTMMWERMESELDDLGVAPEDREKVLTLASIAEKEARDPDDYGRVVRTLENRLEGAGDAHGKPMKLQLDSTVAYFTGSDSISTTPEQRATDSPYNTYLHEGLPIGPISNPGKATLEAAADPPQGKWLYWVTVDTSTGETKFADTYAEHEKNVAEWKKRAAAKGDDG